MFPNPIFTVFGQGVYPYGICIAVGILVCLIVFFVYTTKANMPQTVQDFTFFVAVFAIVVGFGFAALYQAFYSLLSGKGFKYNGITVMGGLIGGAGSFLLAYFVVGKFYFKGKRIGIHKKEFYKTFNVAPACITVAHGFGRLGCMCAGCCYGMKTTSSWGIYNHGAVRVPVQLYEAIFLFIMFAILSVLYFKRYNITMHIYLISYGIWRYIIEIFRDDVAERKAFLGLFPSQWQSIIFVLGGIALFVFYIVKKIPMRRPLESESDKN